MWTRPVCLINARVVTENGVASTLRFARRILALDAAPAPRDQVLDLDGALVLPGLINAHDHLELNHYGPLHGSGPYRNASTWIEDVRPLLRSSAALRRGLRYPLADRLLVGGVKNLLAGATTVAHHNPRYRELGARFPVRVVRRYGWAHSFYLEGRPVGAHGESGGQVGPRHRSTPSTAPFMMHLAEGVDATARAELARLDELGCLTTNTVVVHGVGMDREGWSRLASVGAGLVWCPASNLSLFGTTVPIGQLFASTPGSASRVCLGTDSRLTGSSDLLDELRVAASTNQVSRRELLAMVTTRAADVLRLGRAGRLAPGAPADLLVLRDLAGAPWDTLLRARPRDAMLIAIDGRPLVGAPEVAAAFAARGVGSTPAAVEGTPKLLERRLVRRLGRCAIPIPELEIPTV